MKLGLVKGWVVGWEGERVGGRGGSVSIDVTFML